MKCVEGSENEQEIAMKIVLSKTASAGFSGFIGRT